MACPHCPPISSSAFPFWATPLADQGDFLLVSPDHPTPELGMGALRKTMGPRMHWVASRSRGQVQGWGAEQG